MIEILKNPKTPEYLRFKASILSPFFSWYWNRDSTPGFQKSGYSDIPYYSHVLLTRPDGIPYGQPHRYSTPVSDYLSSYIQIVDEIFKYNNIFDNYFFLRAGLNCVHPISGMEKSIPHEDHTVPHENIIMYFTGAGGSTYVENEEHNPSEDDVCIFTGEHYFDMPKNDRRIVAVGTFVRYNRSNLN